MPRLRITRALLTAVHLLAAVFVAQLLAAAAQARSVKMLRRQLDIVAPEKAPRRLDLAAAMRTLRIPSVEIALIDGGRLAWSRSFGEAPADALYQAASLSKLVTAVAALRLVQRGALDLDRNVNDDLTGWKVPDSPLTQNHPVTLRGLLSMTAGIGVPGYLGYAPGMPLPSLAQILDGAPNSPAVRVEKVPGTGYAYSGGGFEIVQALIESKTKQNFQRAMKDLLLRPAAMTDSFFLQPPAPEVAARAAAGHYADGKELPGGWRVVPELAAGGLWSSAADLGKLLVALVRSYRGQRGALLDAALAHTMMTVQNGGPYGSAARLPAPGQASF